jgi:hypothetical protein
MDEDDPEDRPDDLQDGDEAEPDEEAPVSADGRDEVEPGANPTTFEFSIKTPAL